MGRITSFFGKEFKQGTDNFRDAKRSVNRMTAPKPQSHSSVKSPSVSDEGVHISNTTNDRALLNNKPTSIGVPREKEYLVKNERQVGKVIKVLSSHNGKAKPNAHLGLSLTGNRRY